MIGNTKISHKSSLNSFYLIYCDLFWDTEIGYPPIDECWAVKGHMSYVKKLGLLVVFSEVSVCICRKGGSGLCSWDGLSR